MNPDTREQIVDLLRRRPQVRTRAERVAWEGSWRAVSQSMDTHGMETSDDMKESLKPKVDPNATNWQYEGGVFSAKAKGGHKVSIKRGGDGYIWRITGPAGEQSGTKKTFDDAKITATKKCPGFATHVPATVRPSS